MAAMADGLNYMITVKAALPGKAYEEFKDALNRFTIRGLPTVDLLARISDIFNGYPTIIPGLNKFLPHGFNIEGTDDGKTITVTTPEGATTRTYP